MKRFFSIFATVCFSLPLTAFAITITTSNGKVFENAKLQSFDSETALIKHTGGVARVPLVDLSKTARKELNLIPNIDLLKADYARAVEAAKIPLTVLDEQYGEHLKKSLDESRKAGELGQVLLYRKELEAFPNGKLIDYSSFAKLKEIRAVYDAQIKERSIKGVETIKVALTVYSQELTKLEVASTRTGDLVAALNAREEHDKTSKLLDDRANLLTILRDSGKELADEKPNSITGYYALVASVVSDLIASVNLESGEVKILHQFKEESTPRGIAVLQSGTMYVGLRNAGMNVVQLTPKTGGGFDLSDVTTQLGNHGVDGLKISRKGQLLAACDVAGTIWRHDINRARPMPKISIPGMGPVVGIDVESDNLYAVEVLGGRIAKIGLGEAEAKGEWLNKSPSEHLKVATGITVGHNSNLFIIDNDKTTIPEFSEKTGEFVDVFFDTLSIRGIRARSSDITYVSALKSYFIVGVNIISVDTEGKLIKEIPLPQTVQGGWAITIIQKNRVSKLLGDQL